MKKYFYHILISAVLIALAVLTCFNFASHRLLAKSFIEFIDSCVFWWKSLFSTETISKDGVSFLTFDDTIIKSILPIDFNIFSTNFVAFWKLIFNGDYFVKSASGFGAFLKNLMIIILLLAPFFLVYILYRQFVLFRPNNKDASAQSIPLKCYLFIKKYLIKPVFVFLNKLWERFWNNVWFKTIALLLILYNLNIISFVFIFLAFYLYFTASIDFLALYYLLCKLLICLSPLFHPAFIPGWIVLAMIVIYKIKLKIGYMRLQKFYQKNDEFIGDLGIVTGIYGVPGSGKNLLEIAIATQKEVQLRVQAEADMMEIRLEFPEFPWRTLEEEVEELRFNDTCVNKVQVKYHFFDKLKDQTVFYGYDTSRKKSIHYDELKEKTLFDEILDYAQLYFIFISSLACSTYSVRYDKGLVFTGAFPSLNYDFFHRDFRNDHDSEYAKIFNLNLIRLLKQVEERKSKDKEQAITLFDFGLLTLSEFGKDRGNRYTNQSRKDNDVKPSNDGTASCFGVFRHLTTVRNHQYGFVIWDEQKLSSFSGLEAAIAETNIFINKNNKECKLAIPLFFIEGTLIEWGYSHFQNSVDKYIHIRNDQTLYSYVRLKIAAFFANWNRKLTNIFGYRKLSTSLSGVNVNGQQESRGDHNFYLMNKIVFSNRYKTDCYSGFFDKLKLQANKGINQFDSYNSIVATAAELLSQNGYFASELFEAIANYMRANESSKHK